MRLQKYLILFLIFIFLSQNTLAYLDPGTGSALFAIVWPLVVAFFTAVGAFVVKRIWKPSKNSLLKITKKKEIIKEE